ncbi:hypothetical protein APHAL10511_003684 [Amanita phalloides]|nr:hypothetical protein APHAL10511_003684 [Amanita phalloides]
MHRRAVSTLDARRLCASDLLDVAGLHQPRLMLSGKPARLYYRRHEPFPAHSQGFLYYHVPPNAPPLVGQLRFRCAPDFQAFHRGADLSFGPLPWSLSPYALANHVVLAPYRELLKQDGLLSQAILDLWTGARKYMHTVHYGPGHAGLHNTLYYLRQPFLLSFETKRISFFVAAKDQIYLCHISNPLVDWRIGASPYSGCSLVRFESSPDKEKRVALRILKIVEPVHERVKDYDRFVRPPAQGELIQRGQTPAVVTRSLNTNGMMGIASLPEDLP